MAGKYICKCAKGRIVSAEHLYKRVGHRTGNRYPEVLAGQQIAGAAKTCQVGAAGNFHTGVMALGPPHREVDQRPPFGGLLASGSLCGDHGLKTDGIEQEGFENLGFDQRGGHLQDRFIGKKNGAFRQCGHRTGKAKRAEGC